ncbi:Ig-like domain-containing protein [Deinococcus hopiensis]|uniref:Ig-like domain-containing protein n=1 Tax=Deinococcus hopiensis TaxID=309885 RepID=UPI003CCC2D88
MNFNGVGVTKVEFYRGRTLIGTDTASPYSGAFDLTGADNGQASTPSQRGPTARRGTWGAAPRRGP